MKYIYWFSWQPTPYNDVLFRALNIDPEVTLEVTYRTPVVTSHPWRTPLATGYVARYYQCVLGIDCVSLLLPMQSRGLFVIAGWDHPTTILLLSLLRVLRRRYLIWTDTPNPARLRPRVKAWMRMRWLNWILRGAYRVLATGDVGVSAIMAMGVPMENTVSFPFWLDLDRYQRSKDADRRDGGLRFISSGRLICDLKGHDLALRALATAMSCYPGKWEYWIAGTGKDQNVLEALAVNLGIADHVKFLGWVEPEDLIDLYINSDVLIHPSPVHDPFPNAVLEGMAACCVVMASDVCGSALDRIEHGINGYLHVAGDWHQLSDQIKELALETDRRAAIASRARITAGHWPVSKGVEIIKSCAV